MEFIRDRGTFFWNLLFPILLVFGFSFAFSGGEEDLFKIGLLGESSLLEQSDFLSLNQISKVDYNDSEDSYEDLLKKLRMHQMDMLIDFNQGVYYINNQSPNAEILRLLWNKDTLDQLNFEEKQVDGAPIRYVDWLVPGVIGMNMLFSCLFGVGFVIVRYRKNGVLKRLKATPVTATSFITAQMVSRFLIVIFTSIIVFAGTNIFLKFMMLGSFWNLILLTSMSIFCMISLGLVFASRFKSEELASGIMNLVTFPMIIFSGVFFSLEGSPEFLQKAARVFPLTHFIEGARSIMLEGAGLGDIAPHLLVLGLMTLLFLGLASLLFQWD